MAKHFYDGSAPCPGCGRPGSIVSRLTKDSLCRDCQRRLELGTLAEKDMTVTTFGTIKDFVNIGLSRNFALNSNIEYAMVKFFNAFNSPSSLYATNSGQRLLKINFDYSARNIVLPKFLLDAASELCQTFHEEGSKIAEQRRNLRSEAEQQLNDERNKIYNEGVAHGRKLLFQLNNNEISLKDFEADVKKF